MFDLIVNGHRNTTRRDLAPLVISWTVHVLAIGAVALLPLLFATQHLPVIPEDVLTYVAIAAPPPPPPPPPPAAPAPAVKRESTRPVPRPRPVPQAPVVAPRELPPAIDTADDDEGASDLDSFDGVAGGVPGGIPGGVLGGVVGGIADVPPPPPPPPPAPRAPVRTGGQIQAPELVKRVPPVYPPLAVSAQVQGVVILEATVGRDGRVEDVEVLRSVPLLDRAAVDAVRQWVYEPLLLNGQAERFVLTVTVSFSLS
jgi:periplasmic protein TonB